MAPTMATRATRGMSGPQRVTGVLGWIESGPSCKLPHETGNRRVHYNETHGARRSPSNQHARVAKSADAKDLKSFFRQRECGFKSHPGHHALRAQTNSLMPVAAAAK